MSFELTINEIASILTQETLQIIIDYFQKEYDEMKAEEMTIDEGYYSSQLAILRKAIAILKDTGKEGKND